MNKSLAMAFDNTEVAITAFSSPNAELWATSLSPSCCALRRIASFEGFPQRSQDSQDRAEEVQPALAQVSCVALLDLPAVGWLACKRMRCGVRRWPYQVVTGQLRWSWAELHQPLRCDRAKLSPDPHDSSIGDD